jgi:hypothetical protein
MTSHQEINLIAVRSTAEAVEKAIAAPISLSRHDTKTRSPFGVEWA